ncbi:uncharacterized protein J4E79_011260 [Alternaria viburni]|uniref:uncharacterized protein n=1 Tax=Alternaria viburni TaxID=566460 RepID=UPI0020C4E969|nr:uncharacterized protein J4E79_011260 [Alternaria viburni]KAI4643320.1 hypothetical protein J4E79_011260 [Alternaria viburni]
MPPKTPNLKGAEPPGDTQAEAQERTQAIATIIANWGQAFSTMTSWMHADTWLQGSTEKMTEFTCDMTTIRAFRDLSINHPNQGQEVKDQIEQYYIRRYHGSGPIGNTKEKKMGYICEDLQKLLGNNFIDQAKFKVNNTKKRPAAGKGPGKKQAARKKTKKNNTTASNDQDEDHTITSEVEEEDTVVPESDEAEDDEPPAAPNPKPATKPVNDGAVNEFRRRLRSHGKDEVEKGAQQTGKEGSNASEADDDTSSIFSEAPEAQTIHTREDKDAALSQIYSNWGIHSLHRDFPAILRGGDLDAPEDTGIEDVIIELLRDLSERFPTKRQGKKISEELEMRCKRMKRYSLKAIHQAITATARSWVSESESEEDWPGLSGDKGDANERGPQPEAGDANDQALQSEAAPPAPLAARPDKQRRYAARSDEASFEMQAAWDAVVVAEAAVRVAQAQRVRAALESETAHQQAIRQLRVTEEQLRVAEGYALARSLGRPQRVGKTAGPGEEERTQRRSGDGGGVVGEREQRRGGGVGENGDVEVNVGEGDGNGEGDEEGRVA